MQPPACCFNVRNGLKSPTDFRTVMWLLLAFQSCCLTSLFLHLESEYFRTILQAYHVEEMIQATGDIGTQWILDLRNGTVKEGCIPEDWKVSVVLPIYKGKVTQRSVDLIEKLNC